MKKYAIVTGASRGIGKAIVEELLRTDPNLNVFAIARNKQALMSLTQSSPQRIIPIVADLNNLQAAAEIKQIIAQQLGANSPIAYLIHNAATITPIGDIHYLAKQPLHELATQIQSTYQTNVISPQLLTIALSQYLTNNARVLFISSRAADVCVSGLMTYACTKACVDHLALNFQTFFENKIAVGLVIPGEVDTEMQGALRDPNAEQLAISSMFQTAKKAGQLVSPAVSAKFIAHLLCATSAEEFSRTKWDIYFNRPSSLPAAIAKQIPAPPPYLATPE